MREFLYTRTKLQWALLIVWISIISLISHYDWSHGRHVLAIGETVVYTFLFAAMTAAAHHDRK